MSQQEHGDIDHAMRATSPTTAAKRTRSDLDDDHAAPAAQAATADAEMRSVTHAAAAAKTSSPVAVDEEERGMEGLQDDHADGEAQGDAIVDDLAEGTASGDEGAGGGDDDGVARGLDSDDAEPRTHRNHPHRPHAASSHKAGAAAPASRKDDLLDERIRDKYIAELGDIFATQATAALT